jgi:hypothetical protein
LLHGTAEFVVFSVDVWSDLKNFHRPQDCLIPIGSQMNILQPERKRKYDSDPPIYWTTWECPLWSISSCMGYPLVNQTWFAGQSSWMRMIFHTKNLHF